MADNEMLHLILESVNGLKAEMQTVNSKFDKIENRLDKIENRLDVIELKQDRTSKKLEDLQFDVKIAEREIRRDIHNLKDQMETVIEVLKEHELLPG